MSSNYFFGNNLYKKAAGSGKTAPTYFWFPETEPVNNVDGTDAKGQGQGSKWDRVKAKMHSTTSLRNQGGGGGGKGRTVGCIGKYDLGRKWKYRKTMKKLLTASGAAASTGTPRGERNMFSAKGNNNTGGSAENKNNNPPLADQYALYPVDQGK